MFIGTVEMLDVAKLGRIVLDTQDKMAAQRVKTNSRVGTIGLDQGTGAVETITIAVTNAPDVTEGTHNALARLGTDITMTTALRYGKGTAQMTVSLRAQNKAVDVREMARTMGGGGNSQHVAGGEVEIGFAAIPFMESFKDVEP
jgi:hypothetical protein